MVVHAYFHPIMLWRIADLRKRQKKPHNKLFTQTASKIMFSEKKNVGKDISQTR